MIITISNSKSEDTNWSALSLVDGIDSGVAQELTEENFRQYIGEVVKNISSNKGKGKNEKCNK